MDLPDDKREALLAELRRVEAERERLRDALGLSEGSRWSAEELLNVVSHELRTPIHIMMGFGRVLQRSKSDPLTPGQQEYLEKMLQVTGSLASLVEDILDMGNITAGHFRVTPESGDLEQLLADAVESLEAIARQKSQRLQLEVADLPGGLVFDLRRMRQVVVNLVVNAIKFTPEGGRITVRAAGQGDVVRVEVEDNGPGIPLDQQPRLFKPFSQLDLSDSRSNRGVGLGLSISKAIVEAHGGTIGVESEVGRGATFWFSLPVAASGTERPEGV
jgi:signal transduction histidine kinase